MVTAGGEWAEALPLAASSIGSKTMSKHKEKNKKLYVHTHSKTLPPKINFIYKDYYKSQ